MKLYKVTCCSKASVSVTTLDVFVIATDASKASNGAMDLMEDLSYSYTDYVSDIELIAANKGYDGPALLTICK